MIFMIWLIYFISIITELIMNNTKNIAVIGSGLAGISAASYLAKNGYKVTVYDRYDRAGGLLIYGIPNFKLEKHVVERRTK